MRIAIDVRLPHYTRGGIARNIRQLVRHLPLVAPEQEFLLLHARKAQESLCSAPNLRHVRVWTPSHHRLERSALAIELSRLRPQLVHMPDFIATRELGWRSVITIHDLAFLRFPEILTPESRRYYADQVQQSAHQARLILSNSETTKQEVVEYLGIAPEKIRTALLACDERFQPQSAQAIRACQQKHALPSEYLLYLGTFEPRKNIPGLLNGYAVLRQQMPDAPPLLLVGNTGWLFDGVKARVQKLGLQEKVRFVSDFPDADLPALYAGASAFTLMSSYEGFGLPVLEAMACGTPSLCSTAGALAEVAQNAALYADPQAPTAIADGLKQLLQDSALHAELRQRGLMRAREFSWRKNAQITYETYLEALS